MYVRHVNMYVCELHDPIAHRLSGHLVPLGAVMLPPRAPRPLLVSGRREAARVPLQREKRTKLVPGWREDEGASEAKCSVSENETQAWRVRAGSGRAGGGQARVREGGEYRAPSRPLLQRHGLRLELDGERADGAQGRRAQQCVVHHLGVDHEHVDLLVARDRRGAS